MLTPSKKAASASYNYTPSATAGTFNGEPVPKAQTQSQDQEQFGPQHFAKMLDMLKEAQKTQAEMARTAQIDMQTRHEKEMQQQIQYIRQNEAGDTAIKVMAQLSGGNLGGINTQPLTMPSENPNNLDLAQIPQASDVINLIKAMNESKLLHEQQSNQTRIRVADINANARVKQTESNNNLAWNKWQTGEKDKAQAIIDKYGHLQDAAADKLWLGAMTNLQDKPLIKDPEMGITYSLKDLEDPLTDRETIMRITHAAPNVLINLISSGLPLPAVTALKEYTSTGAISPQTRNAADKIKLTNTQKQLFDRAFKQINNWKNTK